MRPSPVTVLRLEEREPARETRLTGSVVPYPEEKIGFEVAGRILAVLDVGREVDGPAYDENDRPVREGDIVAEVDDTRYQLRTQALEARLKATKNELKAQPQGGAGTPGRRDTLKRHQEAIKRLDIESGAASVRNLLTGMAKVIESICRIVGRNKVSELSPDDLAALDPETARVTGVELV